VAGPYRTQVTLAISGWRRIPGFLRATLPLLETFRRAPGARRLDLSASPANRQFTTFSSWGSVEAAEAYARSPEHREAVRASMAGLVDEFLVVHGNAPVYRQRCPGCQLWQAGAEPSPRCSRCGTALPNRIRPETPPAEGRRGGAPPILAGQPLPRAFALAQALSDARTGQIYRLVNATPLLWWALMILAPGWRVTEALVRTRALMVAAGLFYGTFLLKAIATESDPPNYGAPEGIRALMRSNSGLLAGWSHYLAFDLFVGLWIYRTGLVERRSTRLPLLLTFLTGPLGLLWFLVQRGLARRLPYPFAP
jgi:hypothetical protein